MNFKYLKRINGELKISLEDEGLTFDQATEIACLSHQNQIPLNIKIGGAEAISDMRFANNIGCIGCVAPMVESSYALHKFISSTYKNSFTFQRHLLICSCVKPSTVLTLGTINISVVGLSFKSSFKFIIKDS